MTSTEDVIDKIELVTNPALLEQKVETFATLFTNEATGKLIEVLDIKEDDKVLTVLGSISFRCCWLLS